MALKIGFRAGYRPWELFRLTLPEINLLASIQNGARMDAIEEALYCAHTGATLNAYAYHDPKKMPKLKSLLPKRSKKEPICDQEMAEECARKGIRVPV